MEIEEGSLRCDCNVSVRKVGAEKLGTKVELKNINSFRFVEKAIDYEIDRQIDQLESGKTISQETRLYDPDKNRTFTMRTKENAEDYRYFPDPDLLPLVLSADDIERIRKTLPELPIKKTERFQKSLGLSKQDADMLTSEKELAEFFELTGQSCGNYKASANWVMVELLRELNNEKIEIKDSPITATHLAQLISLIDGGKISGKIAKTVFAEMWKSKNSPQSIIEKQGLGQVSDAGALEKVIESVLSENPSQVAEYRSGKTKVFGFFVGAVMKASKGQANPDMVNGILKKKLDQG